MKNFILLVFMFSILSCGSSSDGTSIGGTTGGNPATSTLVSRPYTNDGTVAMIKKEIFYFWSLFKAEKAVAAPVSTFRFCVTKLKVVSEVDGQASNSREAILGLIDVSDNTATTNWGNVELTDGETVSELQIELHRDPENCSGVNYSLLYNGSELTKDLEFKFRFDPAITAQNGDTLQLDLSVIAKAIEDASSAGQLNNEQISNFLQANTIGTGQKL
ncbi:MAG: hypothetical protein CME69_00855 [Halobacteriovorax sp.]|nr:hypothetical protein [Halobacteriovorax sp.]|tara:strand:+ start:2433 stop:3083 length:651 start_codon:yes stop_codon:yes gene_type:complete